MSHRATNSAPPPPPASEAGPPPEPDHIRSLLGDRPLVLIGMMGAGKSSVGRRLAARLSLPFVDADTEIELAAGQTIPEIFETHGEAYFREGERKVIARLLEAGARVVATGGGAWMNPSTRQLVGERGVSVWLRADPEILLRRVQRRTDRPLLRGDDPEGTLRRLVDERYPTYALCDVTIESREVTHDVIVGEVMAGVGQFLEATRGSRASGDHG